MKFVDRTWLAANPEVLLILFFLPVLVFGAFWFELCFPTLGHISFVLDHYIVPVVLGLLISLLAVGLHSWRDGLKIGMLCSFSVFAHFNFKAWVPLVNPLLFDYELNKIDLYVRIPEFARRLRVSLDVASGLDLGFLYHGLFVFLFFLCFLFVGMRGGTSEVRRLNYSMCFVLLLGGVLYWVLPALGPFVYFGGNGAQLYMEHLNDQIRISGAIPDGFFIQGMAAMPSLHLAHATVFVLHALRASPRVSVIFVAGWLWFFIESMASGWHYFADIPVGVMLGCLAVLASNRTCLGNSFRATPESLALN